VCSSDLYAARHLIADALDLAHRFPRLWTRVQALEVKASYARHVAEKARHLTPEQAGIVDARVAESADGRISWTRFETLVQAAITTADLEAARAREEEARRATFVRRCRESSNGMASLFIRADIATIETIDAAITHAAALVPAVSTPDLTDPQTGATDLGETNHDERRVEALLRLVTGHLDASTIPGPNVELFVHTYRSDCHHGDPRSTAETEGVVRIEGHGPVTTDWLRTVLGPRARFTVRPVIDIDGQAPVDAYEIPDRHRRAVRLLSPADVFPYASSTSPTMQIDHTQPWQPPDSAGPPGQTRIGNLGPMTTLHHRIKTHSRWATAQPFPGIHLWRDPHGAIYLVDHTGTRRTGLPHAA
jgi:hypothetical protein